MNFRNRGDVIAARRKRMPSPRLRVICAMTMPGGSADARQRLAGEPVDLQRRPGGQAGFGRDLEGEGERLGLDMAACADGERDAGEAASRCRRAGASSGRGRLRRSPRDGPCETGRVAGAGRPRRSRG
ncbi:MAG: hypothetical protein ACLFTG_03190 [Alphaproteobacteria bacterium]